MSEPFSVIAWGITFIVGYLFGKGSAKMDFAEKLYFPELRNRYEKFRDNRQKEKDKLVD